MKAFKYFALFAVALTAISFASCKSGADDNTFEVTVDNTTISGRLSQYFSLADKTYKYEKGIIDKVSVELTCIAPLPEDMKAYIGVEVLDENGTVISAGKPDAWSFSDYQVLQQASEGQTVTISIENHENVGDETPAKIRLNSVVEDNDEEASGYYSSDSDESADESGDESSDDSEEASESGSEDWDALLDSYDEYVTEYVATVKKAAKGDASALAEYASLMQKAQEFSDKMSGAQGEMTPSQWARYMKITNKMTKAAAEM